MYKLVSFTCSRRGSDSETTCWGKTTSERPDEVGRDTKVGGSCRSYWSKNAGGQRQRAEMKINRMIYRCAMQNMLIVGMREENAGRRKERHCWINSWKISTVFLYSFRHHFNQHSAYCLHGPWRKWDPGLGWQSLPGRSTREQAGAGVPHRGVDGAAQLRLCGLHSGSVHRWTE